MRVDCPPTWPDGAKVVFIGEAPGEEEVQDREGFVGKAGRLLQKIIWASGLAWPQVARTNVSKRAPDGGYDSEHFQSTFYVAERIGRRKLVRPSPELEQWREFLRAELDEKRPDCIVACGNEALKALTGQEGITKHRGSILYTSNRCPVVPIIHPSAILRGAQWQELYISSELICRKVLPILDGTWQAYSTWQQQLAPTIDDWNAYAQNVTGPLTIDIETRAGSIACVGFCYHDGIDRAICVPLQTTRGPYFEDVSHEWEFWRGFHKLSQEHVIIGHNIFYDLDWLRDYGVLPSEVHDTMLLWHRMYPELPKGLDFVNMWFNDIPYYKDDGKTWGRNKPDEQLWEYNIKDVVATHRIWRQLDELSRGKPARHIYETYTRPLMPLAFEMQTLGLGVDGDGVMLARAVLQAELDKIRYRLADLSAGELVVRPGNKKITDRQVTKYLYEELKLPPKYNRKTKALTADEDALIELLIQNPDVEVLKAINAERKFGKALNSYIDINWRPGENND